MKRSPNRPARANPDQVAAIQPWLLGWLVALEVAWPLWPSESAARAGDGLAMVILGLVLAAAWLAAGWMAGTLSIRFCWIDAAVVALVALAGHAAINSARHDATRPALNMLWEWIGLGVGYLMARQLIATPKQSRAVIVTMIALAVATSTHGLYQYFVSLPATRAEYAANADALLRQEGMWYPPGSVERELLEQRLFSLEPLASFALTNSLAGFLTPWIVVIGAVLLTLRSGEDRLRKKIVASVVALLVAGTCLILTKSRSAYAAVVVGLAVSAVMVVRSQGRLPWKIVWPVAVALLMAIGLASIVGGLDWEVLAEAPKSLGYRQQYWQATWQMIADHPWLGVGPGNFGDHYTHYKLASASEEISDPHNFVLEVWATAGTPALVALMAVLIGLVWTVITARRGSESLTAMACAANDRGARFAIGGGLAGYLLAVVLPLVVGPAMEVPFGIDTAVVELLIAALLIWLWYAWIESASLPGWVPLCAALALAINLLAAGGIAFPAVAASFWLLAAIGINFNRRQDSRRLSRAGAFVGWSLVLVLVAACIISAYQPVVTAAGWIAKARSASVAGNLAQAEKDLLKATAADRYSSIAWTMLADVRSRQWQQLPGPETFAGYEQPLLQAIAIRPYQAALWLRLGECYLSGLQHVADDRLAQKAVAACRQAVKLYPNHAREHAWLALALAAAGEQEKAKSEAAEALRFDAATPHVDQKLRPELRESLAKSRLIAGETNK